MRICCSQKGAEYAIEKFILFGKYRVLSVLGTGSSSTVYLAEHLKLKVSRAIKCIPKNQAGKSFFTKEDDFFMESTLLTNLNHPGIPIIYDIEENDDTVFLIEEYIQGESLDTFVFHQENISLEQILDWGIQLCDILDYLHHLSPYPILYQDLKPEHIILCGNQIKLIDFGIASYFTGSDNYFHHCGTEGFASPEVINGLPATPSSDIYSLGKILEFLAASSSIPIFSGLPRIIARTLRTAPEKRYPSAAHLKSALCDVQTNLCSRSSHLIRNIAVIGSRIGAGATHFSVSLVSTMNKMGNCAIYQSADTTDPLSAMAQTNRHIKEQDGIVYYEYFRGFPDYGSGVDLSFPENSSRVMDFGNILPKPEILNSFDLIFFIFSGSDWDMPQTLKTGQYLFQSSRIIPVCNYHNKKAAQTYAKLFNKKICCFPCDPNPYLVTREKERFVSKILQKKGVDYHLWF